MIRSRTLFLLAAIMILGTAVSSSGAVFVSVAFGPPVLPVYVQPLCPVCPGPGLYLDSRLLGMESGLGRLLLGAGNVGTRAATWLPLDAWLLGLFFWPVLLASRLLGANGRLLRRY